jgi:hypothetical protein
MPAIAPRRLIVDSREAWSPCSIMPGSQLAALRSRSPSPVVDHPAPRRDAGREKHEIHDLLDD